jgi:hypothetical protein
MLVSSVFILLVAWLFKTELPVIAAAFSQPIHEMCLSSAPPAAFRALNVAIVCAEPMNNPSLSQDFARIGLIHFVMTSGYHLFFLETLIQKAGKRPITMWLTGAVLLFFVGLTNLHLPVLRAFFSWCARTLSTSLGLGWTRMQSLTLAGLAALPFCRDLTSIGSLSLSWIAAIAIGGLTLKHFRPSDDPPLETNQEPSRFWSGALKKIQIQTQLYLFLAPALLELSVPSPLSILTNWLFAPLMSWTVFPMALMTFVMPAGVPISDFFWKLVTTEARLLAIHMPESLDRLSSGPFTIAVYTILLNLFALFIERRSRCASVTLRSAY